MGEVILGHLIRWLHQAHKLKPSLIMLLHEIDNQKDRQGNRREHLSRHPRQQQARVSHLIRMHLLRQGMIDRQRIRQLGRAIAVDKSLSNQRMWYQLNEVRAHEDKD